MNIMEVEPMTTVNLYAQGYEAAYRDMYAMLREENHARDCGTCRPCGVMKEVVENLLESWASRMTTKEFMNLALVLSRSAPPEGENLGYFVIRWASTEDDLPPLSSEWE